MGYHIKGVDPIADLRACLPGFEPSVVLDVGANVGQSAAVYAEAFAQAEIHCFEPVSSVFEELQARFADDPRVRCNRCALGPADTTAVIDVSAGATLHSLAGGTAAAGTVGAEEVEVVTLDRAARERGIERIDLLKVDTEGYDLEVLRGARELLERQAIAVVEVEAGMNPENRLHVPFETLKAFLEGFGYRLFAIYEQKEEWPTLEPHLRRTNPVYLSRETIDRYQGHSPGTPP